VASAVFLVIAVAFYQTFVSVFRVLTTSRANISMASLATEEFEVIRNIPYKDVGVTGSVPNGVIPYQQTIVRDGFSFLVTTIARNIDDPFDGTIGGVPNDLSPADYKLIDVKIECTTCKDFTGATFSTTVAPKNLETASGNGALFIRVFDASGVPVQGADVRVDYATTSPILIHDVTNASGLLQLVDMPPAVGAYKITVSKDGYSTEQTYPAGGAGNPNPTKPYATVAQGQVTQVSFSIDKVSSLHISTVTQTCAAVQNVGFSLTGGKVIGLSPNVPKYTGSFTTDAAGSVTIPELEWDAYAVVLTSGGYDLLGSIPTAPLHLSPDSNLDANFVVVAKQPNALLVTVTDAATQLPISDAEVTLNGNDTLITGRGFLGQTDWSGGPGQQYVVTDESQYDSDDGSIATDNPAGTVSLTDIGGGQHDTDGALISSVFNVGAPSDFYRIEWKPSGQPLGVGTDPVRIQLATDNDPATTTWNFVGPDGTASSYYTLADQNVSAVHNGTQYLRYKLFLHTGDTAVTPSVSDVLFTFTSLCVPPGQVLFQGLSDGSYTVSVSKADYQTYTSAPIPISTPFSTYAVTLSPS
jgi:hypothetical protein